MTRSGYLLTCWFVLRSMASPEEWKEFCVKHGIEPEEIRELIIRAAQEQTVVINAGIAHGVL